MKALLILILAGCFAVNTFPKLQLPPLRKDYGVRNIAALDALIRLGETYNVPMGIVCGDDKIATTLVSAEALQAVPEKAMDQLVRQLPGYEWKERKGVIVVQPVQIPGMTNRMLLTVIPRLTAKRSSLDDLSARLFRELQVQLNPKGTSGGYMAITHGPAVIESFDTANTSVRDILNEIVRKGRSAAWIVLPSIRYVKGAPLDSLWSIVFYRDPPQPLGELCCLNQEAFK